MAVFKHVHPYGPYVFPEATKLIVGTLPPPRFTTGELKEGDVDFCYGSRDGQLWPILDRIFNLNLTYDTTQQAIEERKAFLKRGKIGICDIVYSAERDKIDASDMGMRNVVLRNLLQYLYKYDKVNTLLFTGGNSKNGPEYFFRRLLKAHGLQLVKEVSEVPRIHSFKLPPELKLRSPLDMYNLSGESIPSPKNRKPRVITTVSLTAPSGSANRAVGAMQEYKTHKRKNPEATTVDFRVMQYEKFFK